MATEQDPTLHAIAQAAIEAARAVVQAMTEVIKDNNDRMDNAVFKIGRPIMQQPTFNSEVEDKYSKPKSFI